MRPCYILLSCVSFLTLLLSTDILIRMLIIIRPVDMGINGEIRLT
jgi:hypothetical protein